MEQSINHNRFNHNPLPTPAFPDEFGAAFERRFAEIEAVTDEAATGLNLDVFTAVATVLGSLPEIRELREQLAALPGLNQALIDGLEEYAQAAGEAHTRYVVATMPPQELVERDAEARKLRETFRKDAQALVQRKLIDPARLPSFTGHTGYTNVARDLMAWATVLREFWPSIQGKTGVTLEDLDRAKFLGASLVRAVGLRAQAPTVVAEAARIRRQALTLLVNAYDEVRRGVGYLRWKEGDADTIAPSLHAAGQRKRSDGANGDTAAGSAPPEPPAAPPPATPQATPPDAAGAAAQPA